MSTDSLPITIVIQYRTRDIPVYLLLLSFPHNFWWSDSFGFYVAPFRHYLITSGLFSSLYIPFLSDLIVDRVTESGINSLCYVREWAGFSSVDNRWKKNAHIVFFMASTSFPYCHVWLFHNTVIGDLCPRRSASSHHQGNFLLLLPVLMVIISPVSLFNFLSLVPRHLQTRLQNSSLKTGAFYGSCPSFSGITALKAFE